MHGSLRWRQSAGGRAAITRRRATVQLPSVRRPVSPSRGFCTEALRLKP